jgi:NAD(P) transhydrogenase subunit alpha
MIAQAAVFDWVTLANQIVVFVLAMFVGFEIITRVPATLHTPLMSGSNAIDGIKVVGAILIAGAADVWYLSLIGFIAVVAGAINSAGGFAVTNRMLAMFKSK